MQPRLFLMRRRPTIELAGSAVLRGASRAVRHAELPSLSPLLRDMEEYLVSTRSRGIASPQLGVPLRLFMISSQCDGRAPDGRTLAVLNPRVVRSSRSAVSEWEGCLSVPDYAAMVSRPRSVDVEYETLAGATVRRVLTGDYARVFQHELDHLDGILFTQRADLATLTHTSVLQGLGGEAIR